MTLKASEVEHPLFTKTKGKMMSDQENGGPAFPVVETHAVHGSRIDFGMTLRDYFAGQALAGLQFMDTERTYITDARNCYAMADAMLKARQSAPEAK